MSRTRPPLEQGSLFDLDLDDPEVGGSAIEEDGEAGDVADDFPSDADSPALDVPLERPSDRLSAPPAGLATGADGSNVEGRSPAGARLLAGALDAGLHLVIGAVLLAVLGGLGVAVDARTLAAVGLVLLLFSFFYSVISLAFWGSTPGMTALDLVAATEEGEPLAFGQAARRWLAGVLTVAAAGLPAILVFSGRSLGDRWSGSSIGQA